MSEELEKTTEDKGGAFNNFFLGLIYIRRIVHIIIIPEMRSRLVLMVVCGVFLAAGAGYTVWGDYLPWKRAESANFGHGPGEIGAMGKVNTMYQESGAGVRINYPKGWKVRTVWGLKGWKPATDVVIFTPPENDAKVIVSRREVLGSLVDQADGMIKEKTSLGYVSEERQYISALEDITVLTFRIKLPDGTNRVKQSALAKNGDVLVIVDVDAADSEWENMLGIFWEMYKTLVII